jgi:hypothetical protein
MEGACIYGDKSAGSGATELVSLRHDSACSHITWGMNNRPVGGRSAEMYFTP